MTWLATRSLDHPRTTLVATAIITLALGLGAFRLELRTDGDALTPQDHAVTNQTLADRARFRDPRSILLIVNAASTSDAIATPRGLRHLHDLWHALRRLDVLQPTGLVSLASLPHLSRGGGRVSVGTSLDSIPDDPERFADLLADLRTRAGVNGLLLSPDGRRALFSLPLSETVTVEEAVDSLVAFRDDWPHREYDLLLGGPLMAETLLGQRVLRDLATLVPLMLAVMVVLLYTMLRSPGGVMIPMIETGIVLIWAFGAMGWVGAPIALVTTILPVVLMAMCITDEIHLLERLSANWERPGMRARLEAALAEVGRPIVLTSLTTALGFLSFMSASIGPLREFGLFAAFGILVAMALTFSFIPALIMIMPESSFASAPERRGTPGLRAFGEFAALRPGLCFGLAIGALVLTLPGAWRLQVGDSWVGNFDPDSELVRTERAVNESFWGSYRLDVVFEATPGFFNDPPGVVLMERFVEVADGAPHVGGTETYLGVLEDLARMMNVGDEASALRADELWDLFTLAEVGESRAGLDRLVSPSRDSARARLYVKSPDYARSRELTDFLDAELPGLVSPIGVSAHYSGDLPAATALVESIVHNQLRSVGWAITTVALLLVILSWRLSSLIAVVPMVAAIAALFGIMGAAGIELGIATSMFASLAVGVGVDFGIHFAHRFERERAAGLAYADALRATFEKSGRALFWNAVVLGVGFSVLSASSLKPNHSLGLLLSAAVLLCYVGTFLLLPLLLRLRAGPSHGAALALLVLCSGASPLRADVADCSAAEEAGARELMGRVEQAQRRTARILRMHIETRYAEGSRLAVALGDSPDPRTLWGVVSGDPADTWLLYVFSGPGRMAGTSLLIRDRGGSHADDSTWLYLRAFETFSELGGAIERTTVPGTSLTYEDARGWVAGSKYRFRFLPGAAEPHRRVLACPKTPALADRLGYAALVIDLDPRRMLVQRIEYRGPSGTLLKRYALVDWVPFAGLDRPARVKLEHVVQGFSNDIRYEYWKPRVPLDASLFEPNVEEVTFLARLQQLLRQNGLGDRIDPEIEAADAVVNAWMEKHGDRSAEKEPKQSKEQGQPKEQEKPE